MTLSETDTELLRSKRSLVETSCSCCKPLSQAPIKAVTPSSPSPSKAYGYDYISVRRKCNSVMKAGKDMTFFILKKGNHF